MFFGLNLIFNGVVCFPLLPISLITSELIPTRQMWALFTKALARGTSTTQVSIINTSANFILTALLGFFIFAESLPPIWWLGAAMLVAGNVIIGRREEKEVDPLPQDEYGVAENGESAYSEEEDVL